MVESSFQVASLCMKLVQGKDSDLLQTQREDKLRKEEKFKKKQSTWIKLKQHRYKE